MQELVLFNKTCDELVNGKYILIDIKISAILKIIAENEKLKNIVTDCLKDYDFKTSFNNSIAENQENATITIPTKESEIIAYVYSLFYQFKTGSLEFYNFLTAYFKSENDNTNLQFEKFSNMVIIPFKNAINSLYKKTHIITESEDYQNNSYNKIKTTLSLIYKNMENYKFSITDKEEFTLLLNALYTASENNNKKLVYALMIGLDYFTKKHKKARSAYLSLEECFS